MVSGHDILVVDDDPQVHKMLGRMLPAPQYTLSSAFSADDAMQSIAERRPELVILDIMMPKTSGIEVCNFIKNNPETRDILVLMLSAKDSQDDRRDGLAHGADDYVAKPFHMRHLIRKIEHMLKENAENRE